MSRTFAEQQFQKPQYKHKPADVAQKLDIEILKAKVRMPAVGLTATAALSLALTIGGTGLLVTLGAVQSENVQNYWREQLFGPEPVVQNRRSRVTREEKNRAKQRKSQAQMVVTLGVGGIVIVGMLLSALYVTALSGGILMQRLKNWKFVRVACIMAMIPLVSPLIVLGIPFGIWGLIAISQADVKRGFSSLSQ